jgi:putative ABC transport system permease protein
MKPKTDPEIAVVGVDEYFLTNSGLETSRKKFYGF